MKDLYMSGNVRDGEKYSKIDCPLCGSSDYKVEYKTKNFIFVRCNECGVLYQNPIPQTNFIQKRYDDKYFEYEVENHKNFFELQKKTLNDINIEKLAGGIKGKKFLDIGCATGMLLNHFKNLGAIPYGVEICTESCRYAYEHFGLTLYNGTLENAHYENDFFDIVHFSHLIEHLEKPIEFMKEVFRITKRGGIIIITTPREDSFWAHIYKKKWRSLIPDHLILFSRSHLISLVKISGFEPIFEESWGSIPLDAKLKFLKPFSDRFAKKFDRGDVQCIVAKKV